MYKIWAKIVINHKVKQSIVLDCEEQVNIVNFYNCVRAIAEELKIPTPVVLDSYANGFLEFNTLKFRPRDFLEDVPFDFLVLENGD